LNILLLTSHSIAEYDDLRMLTDLGYPTFSIGAYSDPANPTDDKRPALPEAPFYPELVEACDETRERLTAERGEPGPRIDWAKAELPPAVLRWADTIIVHHFVEFWIAEAWPRLDGKRVVWRTCGQSSPLLEARMARLDGLEVVRYSPRERAMPNYAGESALIRFGKYPDDWYGWDGSLLAVGNVTQNMIERGDATGLGFWFETTRDIPSYPAGPGSDRLGGMGMVDYQSLREYLRVLRAYLYTGTRPASYTLGLVEALMTGTPVVSIDAASWGDGWGGAPLFEGEELANLGPFGRDRSPDPVEALRVLLDDDETAREWSRLQRTYALRHFDIAAVGKAWRDFLGE
jgi:glycosyltransferase involved in cell wall biosynthesis